MAKYIADVGRKITQVELVENLPFYKGSEGSKKELMNLAIAYGHNNGIVIKKTYSDGIEFISGSKLEPTDLDKLIVSYSEDITTGFVPKLGLWSKMHQLTKRLVCITVTITLKMDIEIVRMLCINLTV